MSDLATLSLAIDSRPAVDAATALDRLVQTATKTEGATERLMQSATKTGTAFTATGRAAAEGAQGIDRLQQATTRLTGGATVADRLAQGFDKTAKAAKDFETAAGRAASAGTSAPGGAASHAPSRPGNDNRRGLDSRDKLFLQYQAFDAFSQVSSGASLATVGIQQGTQSLQFLADREGGLKAGLADVGSSALKLCDAGTQRLAALACGMNGQFDPDTDGVQLMWDQMRAYPGRVGGYCQITVLDGESITTRILERWL